MNLYPTHRRSRAGIWMAILAGAVFLQQAASAATITVTTASDDDNILIGTTLRKAITTANKATSADVIVFEIPAGRDRTIDLASELPHLSSNISIINKGDPVTIQRGISLRPPTPEFRIFTITPGNTIVMEGLIIARGVGGVLNEGSTLSMRNCTLRNNSNSYSGGAAIDNKSDEDSGPAVLTLNNCTLSENSTSHAPLNFYEYGGGAIRNLAYKTGANASATLTDCVLRQNSTVYYPPPDGSGGLPTFATPPGAAIASIGSSGGVASLNLTGCLLEDNTSESGGGAIYNLGIGVAGSGSAANMRLIDCTLRNNSAGSGGAITTDNSDPSIVASLEKCTLAGNRVSSTGGAISTRRGLLNLTNCTLSGNEAVVSNAGVNAKPGGGAIYNSDGGTLNVTNCTFKDNRADDDSRASSIYNHGAGTVTTANSIYDRVGGSDVHFVNEGTFTSRGHNICDDNAGGPLGTGPGGLLNATGDKRVTSPSLLALASNGGPTQTCALEQNSVAINAGDDAIAPPADQRGYARSGVSDIGAYERTASIPVSLKPARLGNISTRLGVETGDNVLIGGFIITGTEPKRVMLRALGTSLPLLNRLENPALELFDSAGALIESNDNWVDSANKQAIIDSTIPPSNDLESAMVVYLPAGNAAYTAVVRGADGGIGVALIEVYDLDSAVDSKMANISTRGLVQNGDNVLIAGTIVTGQASQKVIIRAIGPSLPILGKLEDPALELFDANGALLAANDNWRTGGQEAEITATGIPPSNELESAIVYQLPSNNASYTAIVRGVGGTIGIAVVEVYGLAQFSLNP